MRLSLGNLREEIRRTLAGSHPSEAYSHDLTDDPSFKSDSVLVPDDIKHAIVKWSKAMGLSSKKKARRARRGNT